MHDGWPSDLEWLINKEFVLGEVVPLIDRESFEIIGFEAMVKVILDLLMHLEDYHIAFRMIGW